MLKLALFSYHGRYSDLLGDRNWWLLCSLDRILPDVLERDEPRTIPTASAPLTPCRWPAGLHVLNEGTASPFLRTNPPTEQTEALAWLAWRAAWEDRLDDLEADRDRRPSPQLIWRWRTTR
jgi:hypothetical protein